MLVPCFLPKRQLCTDQLRMSPVYSPICIYNCLERRTLRGFGSSATAGWYEYACACQYVETREECACLASACSSVCVITSKRDLFRHSKAPTRVNRCEILMTINASASMTTISLPTPSHPEGGLCAEAYSENSRLCQCASHAHLRKPVCHHTPPTFP